MALKKPHAIAFSKKNTLRPFEDTAAIAFWAHRNDASMFVVGQSTKKRPNGMVLVRTFDGRVLDMCEVGVARCVRMAAFEVGVSHGCATWLMGMDRRPSRRRGTSR